METASQILRKICNYSEDGELNPSDDITIQEALEAMEEYSQQFREISELSDEEIKRWARKTPTCKIDETWTIEIDIRYREGLEDGARWYKEQLCKNKEI